MKLSVRSVRRHLLALLSALPLAAAAQSGFPTKPVAVIVPYSVGGTTDIVGRLVSQQMAPILGQPVAVDNRVGAGGVIGWGTVARAAPDGYTLLTTEMSFTIAPGLLPSLPFDARKAFTHVATAASAPHVLVVHPGVKAQTVAEFVALAKARPGAMNYGSGGNGTNTHLGAELFKRLTGTDLVYVPYKGAGQVLQDLMAGQVQALVTSLPTALPHIKSGRLRALVVAADKRSSQLPDVPSAAEAGVPEFVIDFWVGFSVPAGTPEAVVARLNEAIARAVQSDEGRKRLADQGLAPVGNTQAEAAAFVDSEMKRWATVIQDAGIRVQ